MADMPERHALRIARAMFAPDSVAESRIRAIAAALRAMSHAERAELYREGKAIHEAGHGHTIAVQFDRQGDPARVLVYATRELN